MMEHVTPPELGRPAAQPATVLVVDDVEDNQQMLARWVEHLNHRALIAGDGYKALDLLQSHPVDLILLDVMMPGMSGIDVLEYLHTDPQLRRIPVIVVSALGDIDRIVRCIELGAEDYLLKPYNYVLLTARVTAGLEKKRMRDQEQTALTAVAAANRFKSDFVSMVAHELKSPLTSLLGYTELLQHELLGPINSEQSSALLAIRQVIQHMTTLITDLNDISQIEAGQLQLAQQPLDLAATIAEVHTAFQRQFDEKKQAFHADIPTDLPLLRGDPTRLIQILSNLVSNASKYTPYGGTISLSAETLPDEPSIHITVADTGIGIVPEEQPRVFQPFFRATDIRVRDVDGTGLGLSITKRLVELHGGRIWFETAPNQGTRFHFTFPLAMLQERAV